MLVLFDFSSNQKNEHLILQKMFLSGLMSLCMYSYIAQMEFILYAKDNSASSFVCL